MKKSLTNEFDGANESNVATLMKNKTLTGNNKVHHLRALNLSQL